MRVTYLIGNGFDVSMGLNTSYYSFRKWYCDQPNDDIVIKEFKEHVKNDLDTDGDYWSDFEKGLGKYTAKFTLETVHDFIKCYNDARSKLLEYINSEESMISTETIASGAQEFVDGLCSYCSELRPKEKIKIEKVYPSNIHDNIEIRFITYNYTSILDKFISTWGDKPIRTWRSSGYDHKMIIKDLIHIHGTMKEYPIFGVNDESQIDNKELLQNQQFKSIMIKSEGIDEIDVLWYDEAEQIIVNSDIICIYGLSMGETDARWFETIMKWMKSSESHFIIVYHYTDSPSNTISIDQWSEVKTNVRNKLTSFSDCTEEELKSINPRIFIIENTKKVFKRKEKPEDQQ